MKTPPPTSGTTPGNLPPLPENSGSENRRREVRRNATRSFGSPAGLFPSAQPGEEDIPIVQSRAGRASRGDPEGAGGPGCEGPPPGWSPGSRIRPREAVSYYCPVRGFIALRLHSRFSLRGSGFYSRHSPKRFFFPKKFLWNFSMLLEFIDGAAWCKVDRGLKMSIEPI